MRGEPAPSRGALPRPAREVVAGEAPGAGGTPAGLSGAGVSSASGVSNAPEGPGRLQRVTYLALDTLLSAEELAGLVLSNRPGPAAVAAGVQAVLVAEHFPASGDPLVELAQAIEGVRVEAASRPRHADPGAARELPIAYREDDGVAQRLRAALALVASHPLRALRDVLTRAPGQPSLLALAPAAARIEHDPGARVLALGAEPARSVAARLARLTGRTLDAQDPAP